MMNELVKRLSEGKYEVVIGHREESYKEIKERIEYGYISNLLKTKVVQN